MFLVGMEYYDRKNCLARNTISHSCAKTQGFGKISRSKKTTANSRKPEAVAVPQAVSFPSSRSPPLCLKAVACLQSLMKSSMPVNITGKRLSFLVNLVGSESFRNWFRKICKKLNLNIYPSQREV